MSFYSKSPRHATKLISTKDALETLVAFNAMHESQDITSSVNNCDLSDPERASWRKGIRDGVINTGGEPVDFDFFEKLSGGQVPTTQIDATDLFIKYRNAKDYNIAAQNGVTGLGPGAAVTFTLLKSLHANGGAFSNVSVGGHILIYEDDQWLEVTAISKANPYAHEVTCVPLSGAYTANVRKGRKMMFNPTRFVNGLSCRQPATTFELPGYVTKIQPYRLHHGYEIAIDLTRPFTEVMQFAILFDKEGKEMDSYELFAKSTMRDEFRFMKSLTFLFGQKRDNPSLANSVINKKYGGFMGYIPSMQYGGGKLFDYDPSVGIGFDDDLQALMVMQDKQKKSSEYMVLHGLQFWLSMVRRNTGDIMNSTGCTFETFKRMGTEQDAITKYGITSYHYGKSTYHFKEVDAFSDERSIGNGPNPYRAIFQPSMGMTDSKGRSVPPIEFYEAGPNDYYEIDRDHRKLESGCNIFSGDVEESIMMAVHSVADHILVEPQFAIA